MVYIIYSILPNIVLLVHEIIVRSHTVVSLEYLAEGI